MGGGANQLGLNGVSGSIYDGCNCTNGINLAQESVKSKSNSLLITIKKKELISVDLVKIKYFLGLFGPDHLSYAGDQNRSSDQPSLVDMTSQAINILLKNPNGFVLMLIMKIM
jgi:alkaline phosphatase